jgi:hypothetical protein
MPIYFEIIPPSAKVEGSTYGAWIVRYWQWLTSIPKSQNPLYDRTGEYIHKEQAGPVLFLPNAPENYTVDRQVTIPESKTALVAINTSLFTTAEYPDQTVDNLHERAMRQEKQVSQIDMTINNESAVPSSSMEEYLMGSPPFELQLKEDNILGIDVKPGQDLRTTAVSEGFWMMFKFREGRYILHVRTKGTYDDEPKLHIPYETDINYRLSIVGESPK